MKKKINISMSLSALAILLCTMDGCSDYMFNRFAYLL